jgi:MATE family multidrug resistance protein
MATNVATALIGIADIWVIGQLGNAPAQGAVELGARLLMGILVAFNFLKTATTALTAQSAGRHDETSRLAALLRAGAVALVIGTVLLASKPLIGPLGLDFLEASGAVRTDAARYIDIRFWAAPAWLLNAVAIGWLIGLRRVRTVLVVEVAINVLHVGLDALLVLGLGLGVVGVGYATLASETFKLVLLVGIVLSAARPAALALAAREPTLWRADALGDLFRINRDLFLRTLLLMLATMFFTRAGAQQGAVVLAANAIGFQMFMLSALFLDGFENAAQVLCGEAAGAKDRAEFAALTRAILLRGLAAAAFVSLLYLALGGRIAASFSTDPEVVAVAREHMIWLVLVPLAGVASFVYDGVFVGATWTRAMLGTMAAAAGVYGLLLWLAAPLGNHGLWLAFTAFLIARAIGQALMIPRLAGRTFAPIVARLAS